MKRQASLFGRLMLAFLAVMLIIWLATLARTVYETRVTQKRIAVAENRGWTEQIMLNMRALDAHPERMAPAALRIEQLRARMWLATGRGTGIAVGRQLPLAAGPRESRSPDRQPAR